MIGLYRGYVIRVASEADGYRYSVVYGGRVIYRCEVCYGMDAEAMSAAYGWLSARYEAMQAALSRLEYTDDDYAASKRLLKNNLALWLVDRLMAGLQSCLKEFLDDEAFARDAWCIADELVCYVMDCSSARLGEEVRALRKVIEELDYGR